MMTRDEFEKAVRAMKSEGVPLTMPNLLLRTELPRAVIETWLAEMDRPADAPPASPPADGPSSARPADASRQDQPTAAGEALDELAQLRQRVDRLRKGLVDKAVDKATEHVVSKRLGLDDDAPPATARRDGNTRTKDLRIAAALGLFFGPFGLFYAAPHLTAGLAAAVYVLAIVVLQFVPLLGSAFLAYLLPVAHLAACVASAAYAWRYNRSGKRAALFPSEVRRDRAGR